MGGGPVQESRQADAGAENDGGHGDIPKAYEIGPEHVQYPKFSKIAKLIDG